jgi:membrane fusion protein, macrolide-specific efflux system
VLSRKDREGNYTVSVWSPQQEAAEPRRISVGLNNKITAEVTDGLNEGDLVVSGTAAAGGSASGGGTGNLLSGGGRGAGAPPF